MEGAEAENTACGFGVVLLFVYFYLAETLLLPLGVTRRHDRGVGRRIPINPSVTAVAQDE